MLLTPANFQYFLSVVLAIAQLSGVVILAADSVRAFGLDELLTKEIQDISSKQKVKREKWNLNILLILIRNVMG
jgi:hypothetical protein